MLFKILDSQFDSVIRSRYVTAKVDYDFALKKLVPLISKLDFQRDTLRSGLYSRLETDINKGCIMPPLTIAFNVDYEETIVLNEEYFITEIGNAFVLDGIQRLNTLKRSAYMAGFDSTRPMYINILVCDSMDRLLYRMVTLNNGQRPMSPRHQIEILAANLLDFDNLRILAISEKDRGQKRNNPEAMNKDVIIKGYTAFISQSYNVDNQKIIESKMDELVAEKILSSDLIYREVTFAQVMDFISGCLHDDFLSSWFLLPNNYIGFCAAMANAFSVIKNLPPEELSSILKRLEECFKSVNVSKVKLGLIRRRIVFKFFENFRTLSTLSESDLLDYISQEI